jgi:serine phosphatase RsbU (regulator of sigma subunit)
MNNRINQCVDNLKLFILRLNKRRAAAFILFFLVLMAAIIFWPGQTDKFDWLFYDLAQRNVARLLQPSSELAIVAIDTETLEGVKQRWPWSRELFADLIAAIDSHKPKAILLDIVFQHQEDSDMGEGDKILANTIKKSGKVALISFTDEVTTDAGKSKRKYRSLKMFRDVAFCEGYTHSYVDPDARIRTFSLYNRKLAEEGCLIRLAKKTRTDPLSLTALEKAPETGKVIFARKNGGVPIYRALDLLEKTLVPDIADKIVVVGATAHVLHDYHETSLGLTSGPEILTAALDTIISNRVSQPVNGFPIRLFAALAGFIASFLVATRQRYRHELVAFVIFIVSLFAMYHLCTLYRLFVPLSCFFLTWALSEITYDMIIRFLAMIKQQIEIAEASSAGQIQAELFPQEVINRNSYSVRGMCIPCDATGGDFYDYFELENGNIVFVLGDVAGHGFSAAILTIMAKTTIQLLRHQKLITPDTLVSTLNKIIFELVKKKKFMTMIVGHINIANHQIDIVLAGHLPPLLVRADGQLQELQKNGFPMGVIKNLPVKSLSCQLQPGDSLVLYTDGIVEALNWQNEQYTFPAWYNFLQQTIPAFNDDCQLEKLLDGVNIHKNGRSFDDDVTCVIVKRQ